MYKVTTTKGTTFAAGPLKNSSKDEHVGLDKDEATRIMQNAETCAKDLGLQTRYTVVSRCEDRHAPGSGLRQRAQGPDLRGYPAQPDGDSRCRQVLRGESRALSVASASSYHTCRG